MTIVPPVSIPTKRCQIRDESTDHPDAFLPACNNAASGDIPGEQLLSLPLTVNSTPAGVSNPSDILHARQHRPGRRTTSGGADS